MKSYVIENQQKFCYSLFVKVGDVSVKQLLIFFKSSFHTSMNYGFTIFKSFSYCMVKLGIARLACLIPAARVLEEECTPSGALCFDSC